MQGPGTAQPSSKARRVTARPAPPTGQARPASLAALQQAHWPPPVCSPNCRTKPPRWAQADSSRREDSLDAVSRYDEAQSAQDLERRAFKLGQFVENTVLFAAACSQDPVLRLAGVNRALEGLAIDVFTTMKEFGELAGDPYLAFCEDWMLADEVTHVKMGSVWLRKITEDDPERRKKALEFQSVVDKIFSYGGLRSESDESPILLARRFRELAGFSDGELTEIADVSMAALNERREAVEKTLASSPA